MTAPSDRPPARDGGPPRPPVLAISDLTISFPQRDGPPVTVVDGVGFAIAPGEITGIVGESGSGKSMTARAILGLVPDGATVTGDIRVLGEDVLAMSPRRLRQMRGAQVAMIFQDPSTSLDPVQRIGNQVAEAIAVHHKRPRRLGDRVAALLTRVGIQDAASRAQAYPHQFSGGMRQRAMTAMAIANDPALLIADEPTTALDVTVQDQVMQLMRSLNEKSGTAILLITHNIALVASLCSRLIVMYAGRVVEDGPAEALLSRPQHPYTWSLLQSVPRVDQAVSRLLAIAGQPPDPAHVPVGCKFQPRCPFAIPRCAEAEPALVPVQHRHFARCWVRMDNAMAPAA